MDEEAKRRKAKAFAHLVRKIFEGLDENNQGEASTELAVGLLLCYKDFALPNNIDLFSYWKQR